MQQLVSSLRPNCRNLIVIGIGGSSLGTKAIHNALLGEHWNLTPFDERGGPRLFVLENVDPTTVASTHEIVTLDDPQLQHTVVCVISKSGETLEIAANLMVALETLQGATFVAITGETGSLRTLAIERDWPILLVPDRVGGRFSVLSPVGLFPGAMCGVDISSMLDGANAMATICSETENNPAASLSAFLVGHYAQGKVQHIMISYCDGLRDLTHWWVQLWAESLGKVNEEGSRTGPTPMAAVGATDQHSMLQLWREGPADKVIGFLGIEQGQDIDLGEQTISPDLQWLRGRTMREVLKAQQEATREAVNDANQSTWTLSLPQVDACSIGQFFAFWQITTAIAGRMLLVNPYNQPGVEFGKLLAAQKLMDT